MMLKTMFDGYQTSFNIIQQHATSSNMVAKRVQHVGFNNVGSVWPGLYVDVFVESDNACKVTWGALGSKNTCHMIGYFQALRGFAIKEKSKITLAGLPSEQDNVHLYRGKQFCFSKNLDVSSRETSRLEEVIRQTEVQETREIGRQLLNCGLPGDIKYLMAGPKGNSEFCFPEALNVPFLCQTHSHDQVTRSRKFTQGEKSKNSTACRLISLGVRKALLGGVRNWMGCSYEL